MAKKEMPKYPIYIPSKGRYDNCKTADMFVKDKVPFLLVVEPQEYKLYADIYGEERILKLPFKNRGSVIPTRNWIKKHSKKAGYERHWQWDDNITECYRLYKGKRIRCSSGVAMAVAEEFTDRYENIAITGLEYLMFGMKKKKPFNLNIRVYSCSLINNAIPHKWRGSYNEDTDLCLQVLSDGWCTVLINTFLCHKMRTMTMEGGNSDVLYKDDGRLKMARSLQRVWPGVVRTERRFMRPQHVVKDGWRKFDTPLKRKKDINLDKLENKFDIKLKQVAPEVKSKLIQGFLDEQK